MMHRNYFEYARGVVVGVKIDPIAVSYTMQGVNHFSHGGQTPQPAGKYSSDTTGQTQLAYLGCINDVM